jgi:hypothetical protein
VLEGLKIEGTKIPEPMRDVEPGSVCQVHGKDNLAHLVILGIGKDALDESGDGIPH